MKKFVNKRILLAILLPVLIIISLFTISGLVTTAASLTDLETGTGNSFLAWSTSQWQQTTQADFEAGVLNQVDTSSSSGDVRLATFSNTLTDTFDDETKIASKSNIVVTGGQVKLTNADGTETLVPNATGDETSIESQSPGSTFHWDKVDEAVADDDTTYVYTYTNTYQRDLYNLPAHSAGSGTINSITIYFRVSTDFGSADVKPSQKSGTTVTDGTAQSQGAGGWSTKSQTYTTNPATGSAYTWSEIDALQIGVSLKHALEEDIKCTQVYVEVDYSYYNSPGTLTSTNLLSGQSIASVNSFGYNAPAIPSGTNLKLQFSQDNANWFNSAGIAGDWDTLSQGTHSISLSSLGWSGANFYYKMQLTSDGTSTPVLDEISVNYSSYYTSGTIASQVLDTGLPGAAWDDLFWDETLTANTDITFEVRASDTSFNAGDINPPWNDVGGTPPVVSGLPSGRYMQWRAILTTTNTANTPALHEVRVYYY